jgi:hypothetical protein
MNRKLAALAAFAVLFAAAASAQLAVRVGMDLEGGLATLSYEDLSTGTVTAYDPPDVTWDEGVGLDFSVEYTLEVERFLLVGGGLSFQAPRDVGAAGQSLAFLSPYATVRLPLDIEGITMGPAGRVGLAVAMPNQAFKDAEPYDPYGIGVNWAAGLTIKLGRGLFMDLMYAESRFTGEVDLLDRRYSLRYSSVQVALGYRF